MTQPHRQLAGIAGSLRLRVEGPARLKQIAEHPPALAGKSKGNAEHRPEAREDWRIAAGMRATYYPTNEFTTSQPGRGSTTGDGGGNRARPQPGTGRGRPAPAGCRTYWSTTGEPHRDPRQPRLSPQCGRRRRSRTPSPPTRTVLGPSMRPDRIGPNDCPCIRFCCPVYLGEGRRRPSSARGR